MGRLLPAVACSVLLAVAAEAGQAPAFADASARQAPILISRDAAGSATLRAVQLTQPLRIDGRLDEAIYSDVQPISDFVQIEPQEGSPATERTEIWLAFDEDNVYVTFRNFESQPDRVVAKEMRRDHGTVWSGDDIVSFMFDTFHDRRNAVEFTINPIGGRQDGQTTNERQWNGDWNTIWDFAVGRFEGGWIVETAIPFKSLRYRPGADQTWGFNAFRTNRWKNELSYLFPVPKERGQQGLHMASLAAPIVGIVAPSGAKNLEIKPYAISNVTEQRQGASMSGDLTGDVGVDVKYGVTQNLTADLTYNTDFAQVEADTQQVNLTRFSLFFPEKREFFLENSGTFAFGAAGNFFNANTDTPLLFYSRRIGLEGGRTVPIDGGGRLTGRVGRYTLGLLNIQTGGKESPAIPSTNFSVVRLKRDVLGRSSVGLMATGRREGRGGAGDNLAYGVDGTFAFFSNLAINTYWARTDTKGLTGEDTSYRGQLDYTGDRYGVQLDRLVVGDSFNPGVGFVRRTDMRRTLAQGRFSPRPRASTLIRKYSWTGTVTLSEDGDGRLESREQSAAFGIDFQNADRFNLDYGAYYELLPAPFRIASDVTLPAGGYRYSDVRVGFTRAQLNRISGSVSAEHGTFYNGHKTTVGVSGGRVNLVTRFSVEPTYSINRVELVQGSFTTHLAGVRASWSASPFMFTSAFLQYNSSNHALSANVRLRWEYRPGSELFVVYNEDRDTLTRRFPQVGTRAFIVKINRLLRF
jgi:hypothetical protein